MAAGLQIVDTVFEVFDAQPQLFHLHSDLAWLYLEVAGIPDNMPTGRVTDDQSLFAELLEGPLRNRSRNTKGVHEFFTRGYR